MYVWEGGVKIEMGDKGIIRWKLERVGERNGRNDREYKGVLKGSNGVGRDENKRVGGSNGEGGMGRRCLGGIEGGVWKVRVGWVVVEDGKGERWVFLEMIVEVGRGGGGMVIR